MRIFNIKKALPHLKRIAFCALSICTVLGAVGCSNLSGTPEQTPIILEYPEFSATQLSTVKRGDISLSYTFMCFTGVNRYQKEGLYLLRNIPNTEGVVVTYFFNEGDNVKKGDLVMNITFPEDEARLEALRTSISRTQAQLNSAPQAQKASIRAALERLGAQYELLLSQISAGNIYATHDGSITFPASAQGLTDTLLSLSQGRPYTEAVASIYLNPDKIVVTDLSFDPSVDTSRLYGVTGDNFELFKPNELYTINVYIDSLVHSYEVSVFSNPMYGYAADKILGKYTPSSVYNPNNNVIFLAENLPQEAIGKECLLVVDIDKATDCLYVPYSALIKEESNDSTETLYFVEKVIDSTRIQRIPVIPGITSDGNVEIKPLVPLSEGDTITIGH